MIVHLVDVDGIHKYSGHDSNTKVARLEAAGLTRVSKALPEDKTQRKWNGVDWVEIEAEVIKVAIRKLETIPRRIRESLIALGTEDQVILDEDAAIATERGKL